MVLRHGRANALTYPKLAALVFGIPAKPDPNDIETVRRQKSAIRQLQEAVPALRAVGAPVCSGSAGVWLGDRADLDATLASLRRRLVSQYGTFLALRRTRRAMGDYQQTELWAS
jgi:hypothetical protein